MGGGLPHKLLTFVLAASVGALALAACDDDDTDRTPHTGGTTASGGTGGSGNTGNIGTGGSTSSGGTTGAGGNQGGGSYVGGAMPQDASVIFLHHSTGGVIWGGGVSAAIDSSNSSNGTSYSVTDEAYPNSPYPWANYPYDYWHLWVENGGQATAEGIPTLESYTSQYEVVVFKHCFPVSGIGPDSTPDISSSEKTIANYQLQYNALKAHLLTFTSNRFIVWTGAALTQGASNTAQGQRARQFFTWVKTVWDEPCDNIFVWDFFELETEGGNFLLDMYSASPPDSHPSGAFAQTVAPFFAQRIVDVIEGNGDVGSLTGH